ncbi:MAG: MBOAT family O-acyltransferase [Longimicrobiaceae bacterium]
MLFNSFEYVIFFIVVVGPYFALPQRWRKPWLLAASVGFYMSWIPVAILLILYTTTIDYFVALQLQQGGSPRRRFRWLMLSLVTNFGALFLFKYFDFFVGSWASAARLTGLAFDPPLLHLVLPIGISFYTFEAVSYTMDVYRGRYPAERSYPRLLLFITFFPKLIAGPIERAGHLIPQFEVKARFDYARVRDGFVQILWGFFKKLVVADRLALYVDGVYNHPTHHVGSTLLVATLFFAFQIYCDFSAYSDIAIGTARVLGIDLLRNFRRPYFAAGFSDFWSRWHISLSTWFRDYVYIPLGGNRGGFWKTNRNIFLVFLVSGIWHGANWTFVLWGIAHGCLLLGENLWGRYLSPRLRRPAPLWLRQAGTFAAVVLTWVLFRANSVADAAWVYRSLFTRFDLHGLYVGGDVRHTVYALFGIGVVWTVERLSEWGVYPRLWAPRLKPVRWLAYVSVLMLILLLGVFDGGQFIYFQF